MSVFVGSGAQSLDAAAIRCAVSMAVPDGASTLASWCSSMISAVSKYGAASSAKRIISTAPMAKFGAITALAADASKRVRRSSSSAGGEAGRADDGVHPVVGAPGEVRPGGVEDGEVDRHLGTGVGEDVGRLLDLQAGAVDADLAEVDAGVERVDGGHELEVGIAEHRLADGLAHAAAGAEHAHPGHGRRVGAVGAGGRRPHSRAMGAASRRRGVRTRRLAPIALVARTVQLTVIPFARPVTTSGEPAPDFVFDPQVAVYPVMPLPPLLSGFANFTVALRVARRGRHVDAARPAPSPACTGTGGDDAGPSPIALRARHGAVHRASRS